MMGSPQQMTSDTEEILNDSIDRQKSLCLARGLESSHLSLPLARRLVGNLSSVVGVLLGGMDYRWHDLAMSGRVASQLIGNQPPRHAALPLQELAKEAFGGFPITARLDEDIDHITILIHRTP